jgi:co-chaperonin GroES (HSP10)
MRAVGKFIVIEPIKTDATTTGGLLLTEESREDIRYRKGKVIEPGTDVKVLNKGDLIYYDKSAGFGIDIKNLQYKVIKEQDVVIIL